MEKESAPDALARAVREELRAELLLHAPRVDTLPPPTALDAEEFLVSAVLDGHGMHVLGDLKIEEFFLPLHRATLTAVRMLPVDSSAEEIAEQMRANGCVGAILEELQRLQLEIPFRVDLPVHVAAVREAAKKRAMLRWLDDIAVSLRMGRITADQAKAKLRPEKK